MSAAELDAAVATVREYLRRCEQRDLDAAAELLAPGVVLVFPGGRRYGDLAAMVADARQRYRSVRKRPSTWDASTGEDGSVAVVCSGELDGVDLQGRPFEGIRYVDRLVLRDGLITEQHVWNDLAEAGIVPGAGPAAHGDAATRPESRSTSVTSVTR